MSDHRPDNESSKHFRNVRQFLTDYTSNVAVHEVRSLSVDINVGKKNIQAL
jgi:hypothetical protein